ncbi:DUF222 domain-containing protein [Sinomonas sp. G460-2]|uniref:HNH endonuclease signature motif containing protein n=1 Tax=Sinomonas sp. G460-2 TaxID=3393464 RepID=UPI0039EF45AE
MTAGGASDAQLQMSGAVALIPRPGSRLRGRLWHPDPSLLSGEDARRVLVDIGRARSFLAALEALAVERIRIACEDEARRVAATAERERFDGDVAHALVVSEVAVTEGISEFAAARLVKSSEALCRAQLAVLDGLEGGELTEAHARVITDETSTLPDELAEEFGIKALGRLETRSGRRRTVSEFRRAVRALREREHPESIRARKVRATRDRSVYVRPEPDGMCTLSAFVPAEVGLAAFNRLDSLARAQRAADPEDGRTLPQLRADALAELVLAGEVAARGTGSGLPAGVAGESGPAPVVGHAVPSAEIVVLVSAETLLGASDEPATLEGYGPIDAETARDLAVAAPTWQRLVTDIEGVPLALGRTAYRPPKMLRRFIEYRDGTCQFPGCTRPARRTEIDHMVEWQDGGTTDAHNLQALCRKHHALKSLRLWDAQRVDPDGQGPAGDIVWVSPLGGRAVCGPEELDVGREDPPSGGTQPADGKPIDGDGSLGSDGPASSKASAPDGDPPPFYEPAVPADGPCGGCRSSTQPLWKPAVLKSGVVAAAVLADGPCGSLPFCRTAASSPRDIP